MPAKEDSGSLESRSGRDRSAIPTPSGTPDQLATHLFALELSLLDPAIRRDRARVNSLLADDFQEFGASGKIWSRKQILDLLESEPARSITAHELACHPIAEGVALVTYRAVSVDGPTRAPLTSLRSSLWICIEGNWKMRFHQGTRTETREPQNSGKSPLQSTTNSRIRGHGPEGRR